MENNGKRLAGFKTAITGAGSGIGAGIAEAFAREGADVAYLDMDWEGARKHAAEAATAYGTNCFAVQMDVTEKASVRTAFAEIEKTFGTLDTVVCSAGISIIVPFLDCDEKTWDLTMDVNLKGMFLTLQSAIPLMLHGKGGSVICLSSQSGKVGASQYQAYCASKFGVIGFVQSLALEFAPQQIRVNSICPGVVLTPMWDKQVISYAKKRGLKPEEVMPYFRSKIPLGRLAEMEDVTGLAIYLAGDESAYMTGQAFNVAGGQVMM